MKALPRWFALVALVGLAVGLAWLLVDPEPTPDADAPPPLDGRTPVAAGEADPPSEGDAPAVAAPEKKRTRVPKPASVHPRPRKSATPPASGGTTEAAKEVAEDPSVSLIRQTAQDIGPDIHTCLEAWWKIDPTLQGKVVVSFDLNPSGLTDVWIEEHSEVPLGPLSCFSSGVYGADWSGIVEEDTQVTMPFTFTIVDQE